MAILSCLSYEMLPVFYFINSWPTHRLLCLLPGFTPEPDIFREDEASKKPWKKCPLKAIKGRCLDNSSACIL